MSQRTTMERPKEDRAGGLGDGQSGLSGGRAAERFRVRDVEDTLKLYAALALLLEAGLGTLVVLAPTETVQLIAVVGMLAVFALMVVIAGRNWESSRGAVGDTEQRLQQLTRIVGPLWGDEHTPLEPAQVTTLQGQWRCEWSARTVTGDLEPYVDDTLTIRNVDPATGELEATGSATYEKNPEGYEVRGRVSKQGLAHLYYRYPTALHQEKVGMVILRIDFIHEVAEGWWLGGGRGLGRPDTGGLVRWTKADRFEGEWVDRAYDHEDT